MEIEQILVAEGTAVKRIVRSFNGITINMEEEIILVHYREIVTVDGEVASNVVKQYPRDFAYWQSTLLGLTIAGMVNADLAEADPAAPRVVTRPAKSQTLTK